MPISFDAQARYELAAVGRARMTSCEQAAMHFRHPLQSVERST